MAGKTVFKKQVRVTKRKARKLTKAKRRVVKGPLRCKGKRRGAFTGAIVTIKVALKTAERLSVVAAGICEENREFICCVKPMHRQLLFEINVL